MLLKIKKKNKKGPGRFALFGTMGKGSSELPLKLLFNHLGDDNQVKA